MKKSKFLSLKTRDFIKGFVVAVLTIVAMGLMTSLQNGTLPDWATLKTLLLTGLSAGIGYLIKNVFQNSEGKMFSKEIK